ncbi:MAG: hypothetical protein LBH28_10310, partial [Oscillospiraceae bacterium]|nr:hypothetical protein [Oscillospiraceae bacterium]
VCAGSTGLTYSVINVPDVTYTWALPTGWVQTGGRRIYEVVV